METRKGNKDLLGRLGENLAADLLQAEGYQVICRNYRCPYGELDLIVEKAEELLFVEVKTRSSLAFGSPAEAVDHGKRVKLRAAAAHFCSSRPASGRRTGFRIVEICVNQIYDLGI